MNWARLWGDPLKHQKNYGLNSVIGLSPGPTQPPHNPLSRLFNPLHGPGEDGVGISSPLNR